uniref:Uncharacterized protein n=1 Tax=Plectus sambesii TaxID=2011161 RepID=A0A914V051_9BILA
MRRRWKKVLSARPTLAQRRSGRLRGALEGEGGRDTAFVVCAAANYSRRYPWKRAFRFPAAAAPAGRRRRRQRSSTRGDTTRGQNRADDKQQGPFVNQSLRRSRS